MNLHAEQAIERPTFRIIIHHQAHRVAANNQLNFIPFCVLDEPRKTLFVAVGTDEP